VLRLDWFHLSPSVKEIKAPIFIERWYFDTGPQAASVLVGSPNSVMGDIIMDVPIVVSLIPATDASWSPAATKNAIAAHGLPAAALEATAGSRPGIKTPSTLPRRRK